MLLHQERGLIFQQRGLLQQLRPMDVPQEVHPKLQKADELLQQRLKLLDEQIAVMTVSESAMSPFVEGPPHSSNIQ